MNQIPLTLPAQSFQGKGRIEVIFGPMFSGKTTELIRRITRFQFAKFRCLVFKYAGDVRYSEENVATHDCRTIPAVSASTLTEYKKVAMEYDVIGIDEGQFFPDLIAFTESLADAGKTLVVAALDGTYQRSGFGSILELVPLAESVVKLSAVCMVCCRDASFTQRISSDKQLEVIGGSDKYQAVCRECYKGTPIVPNNKRVRTPLKALNENPSLESPIKKALFVDSEMLVSH